MACFAQQIEGSAEFVHYVRFSSYIQVSSSSTISGYVGQFMHSSDVMCERKFNDGKRLPCEYVLLWELWDKFFDQKYTQLEIYIRHEEPNEVSLRREKARCVHVIYCLNIYMNFFAVASGLVDACNL